MNCCKHVLNRTLLHLRGFSMMMCPVARHPSFSLPMLVSLFLFLHVYVMRDWYFLKFEQSFEILNIANLVPRLLWFFGQLVGTRRDSGLLEFCHCRISAVKQCKLLRSFYGAANQKKYFTFFLILQSLSWHLPV